MDDLAFSPAVTATSGPTAAQRSLWLLNELDPTARANTLRRAYRVTGHLDPAALRDAWQAALRRHPVLRTALTDRPDHPVPGTAPDGVAWRRVRVAPGQDALVKARRVARLWTAIPVDPATGPAARLLVLEVADDEHLVVLAAHRVVADDRSLSLLFDELARTVNGSPDRGAPPVDFARHAAQERAWSATPDYRRQLEWWIGQLTPPPPALDLPTPRRRPSGPAAATGEVPLHWGAAFGRRLRSAADTAGCTPSDVVLAGYVALLHRYDPRSHVTIGLPVSTRTRPETRDTIGPMTNLVVLRADLTGAPGFGELLDRVARGRAAALRHRRVPFSDVVRAVNPPRDPRRLPLCDAVFAEGPLTGPELRLGTATGVPEPVDAAGSGSGADLALTVDDSGTAEACVLSYRTALFDRPGAQRVLDQLRTLLDAAVSAPAIPLADLPLEPAARLDGAAADADADPDTAADAPTRTVADLVRRHTDLRPDAVAVDWRGAVLTYRELDALGDAIAHALRAAGTAGRPVVVAVPKGPRQVAALLGVFRAGAHLVWSGAEDARASALADRVRPACLLVDGDDRPTWEGGPVLDVATLPPSPTPARPLPPVALDHPAYLAFTSGSTGVAKEIAQSHAALAQFTGWMAGEFGLGPGSRVAQWVSPEHDPALCEVFATLVGGASLCPVPDEVRLHPERLADWLTAQRIEVIQMVPSFARELLGALAVRPPALRCLLLMGEALPGELVDRLRERLPGTRLVNLFGPTETIAATWHDITGSGEAKVPIGRPIPGRRVLVLDQDDRPCPAGVTGEIVVRSPYVTPGAGGVRSYRTGDLGRFRWDGLLEFRGRRDFQVKLLGNRIELTDLEAALAAHPTVRECAAVALTDPDGLVSGLALYVVPHEPPADAAAATSSWRARLRGQFGALPATFTIIPTALPRTVVGKVDRRALPPPRPPRKGSRGPATPVERQLIAIWSHLLDTDRIETHDTFFEAGGHSLLLPRLRELVADRIGVRLPLWSYATGPTLRELAALLAESGTRIRPREED
ncbi:non-ribosomal peptide synthetase [Saccharothrix longispora]|uniref:non-ribosomal peptide synthetase n=1 Tax=Saccharothrix longispora TaxID=33920 RepID=UPI0028FD9769|nr:AMP-binding protein [Saccharothrix longispora]MDU0292796.1 AMP-binding protein [Saccharothrix longispora]